MYETLSGNQLLCFGNMPLYLGKRLAFAIKVHVLDPNWFVAWNGGTALTIPLARQQQTNQRRLVGMHLGEPDRWRVPRAAALRFHVGDIREPARTS
jgi:hypothetical protein